MTSSNARVITEERKNIVMSTRRRKNHLAGQKLAGAAALIMILVMTIAGGELSALAVLAPMALAAVFSKEKIMDFSIFEKKN